MAKNIVNLSLDGSNYTTRPYGTCDTAAGTAAKAVTCADFSLATGATILVKFTNANSVSSPTLNVNSTGAKSIYYRGAALASSLYYWGAGDIVEFYYNGTQWDLLDVSNTNTTYSSLSASDATTGTATTGRLITAKVLHDKIVEMLPSVSQTATSGNEVGKITVNGTATTLYAPIQTTVSGNAGSATKLATARTIDGVSFNGSANITHYGECSTAAATAAKTVALTGFTLATGAKVAVKFTVTNTAASPTLNVNSTGAKSIMYRGSAISAGYLAANRVYEFVYDGTDYELIGDINTDSNTTYGGDRGISLVSGKFGHSNTAVTAKTAYGSTTTTASANGGTIVVTDIKYDGYGHITGSTDRTITLSEAYKGTVTSVTLTSGTGITVSNSGSAITSSGSRTITLNTAATDTIGGIKIGKDNSSYAVTAATSSISADVTSGKYYAVEIDKDDKAFVYVPWTDNNTKNTAGSTDTSSLIYLIGATSQAANPTTYSHDTAYVGTDGHLYSNSKQVVNLSDTQALTNKTYNGYTLAAACAKGVATSVASGNTSLVTSGAVYTAIANSFAANDAMIFKGTLGTSGTVTALPATHSIGWTYRVITAGTYAGKVCEIGDLIICITDGTAANDAHWTVAQTNIDGAVTGPTSATDNAVAIFNGTGGKIIKNSGFTIGCSVPANAKFTDTTYSAATTSALGLVKISTGLNVSSGAISVKYGTAAGTACQGNDSRLSDARNPLSNTISDSDLNNVTTPGFYAAGGSNTCTNKPSGIDAFGLLVFKTAGGYITQEVTEGNTNAGCRWTRQYTGSAWGSWIPMPTFTAAPTSGQVLVADGTTGKIKSSGYTIAKSVPSNAVFTDTVYSLPLAASGTRGGIQIGYSSSGANVAVQLSSEKAYVALTKTAVTSALGYTPPTTNTTYGIGDYDTSGLIKPWKSYTVSCTGPTAATTATAVTVQGISTTSGRYYAVEMDKDGRAFVNVPWTDNDTKYSLPLAASGTRGGIQIGYSESGVNVAVKLSSEKAYVALTKTAVTSALGYTPPTTNTTYAVADYDTAGLLMPLKSYSVACTFGTTAATTATAVTVNSISTTSNRYYAIEMDKNGRAFVNVPWTDSDTKYTLPAATSSALGGIKVGYTTSGKNYKVELDSNNNAYVNVPWTNTTYSTKNMNVNGTNYAIYTSASSLPTVYGPTAVGTAGQILVSNGSGAPSWQDCGGKVKSTTASVAIATSWGTLLSAANLGTLCDSTVGTYAIQIYGPSSIGYSSGIFTWNSTNSGDANEILLHRTGASTSIYLRMTTDRILQIAGSAAVSSSTITIKVKRLI